MRQYRKIHKSCGAEIMNICSPQVSKTEMMDSFPAANIYLGKTSGRFSVEEIFLPKTRRYFIRVTAETGPELYDPLNVTDKTITAKIPSGTHTRVMKEQLTNTNHTNTKSDQQR